MGHSTPPRTFTWRKSNYSHHDGGDCVETLLDIPTLVPIRDSKHPHGPILAVPAPAWATFIAAVRHGSFRRSQAPRLAPN
ncbi:DUF397 domain-containing protein [Streptomyces gamaensis]|uniref:DUF397 domain-containing protein n=1 Tax=Streptomyces gamaensis TaxID=1763542 RepID=A0ABW0Z4S6_9ACTN